MGLHDGNIEVNQTNIKRLMSVIRKYQPTVLLFPHWLERHPDHEHAHRLCREAWFYSGLEKIVTKENGRKQEPFRPKKYFHFMQKYEFTPTFIVDVSDVYETKQRSLTAFSSQFYNPKSKERETILSSKIFLESIYARDRHFGSLINVAYGEPFYSVEPLGFSTFFDIMM
jgi:bacillithiol biosynthesis deacetylase BshB1